jgi:recombination protein RecT
LSDTIERPPAAPPAKQDSRPLREIQKVSDLFTNADFIRRIERAVSGQVSTSLMLSALAGSYRRSPQLAECGVMDVAGKALLLAQAGLPPDTVAQHSHLIPFKEKVWNPATRQQEERYICQMVIGYHGLLDLAYRSGKVSFVIGRVAWRDEVDQRLFEYQLGTDEYLKHIQSGRTHDLSPEAQANGTAEYPSHAYAIAHMNDARNKPFEVWPISKVLAIRDTTPAYRFAKFTLAEAQKNNRRVPAAFAKAPWVAFTEKMAAKTMVRQLCTWLPRSLELATMAALDEYQERRPIDLGPIIDSTDYMAAAGDAAEMSGDPGAAYGYRGDDGPESPPSGERTEPPQERRQPRQERAPRQTAAKPPEPPQPPPAPPTPPQSAAAARQTVAEPPPTEQPPPSPAPSAAPFDDWLLDEQGDPVQQYDSPLEFARALEATWTPSNNKEALLEQNRDAMERASAANLRAANIITSMEEPREPPAQPVVITLTHGRDGPVWADFIRNFKAELAKATTAESFNDFYAANVQIMQSAQPSSLSLLIKGVVETCKRIGIPAPAGLTEKLQHASAKPVAVTAQNTGDRQDAKDEQIARNIEEEIARTTDANVLRIYSKREAVGVPRARWKAEGKTALYDRITEAFQKRLAEIEQQPQEPAP